MKGRLLLLIVILAVAIGIGVLVSIDVGELTVAYGGWIIETSLGLVVVGLLLLLFVISLCVRLITYLVKLPKYYRRWHNKRRRKRAAHFSHKGLLALAGGNYPQAVQAFTQARALQPKSVLNHLGEASALQHNKQYSQRDEVLQALIGQLPAKEQIPVEIFQIRLQLRANQMSLAGPSLYRMEKLAHRYPYLKDLLTQVYIADQDWGALITLIPRLTHTEVKHTQSLTRIAYQGLLDVEQQKNDVSQFMQTWQHFPRHVRRDPQMLHSYIEKLCALKADDEAEYILRRYLHRQWDTKLIYLYGKIQASNVQQQLTFADKHIPAHPNDANLWLTLATLAQRAELWGQTRHYFERCLQEQPSSNTHIAYAEFLYEQGEFEMAAKHYKIAHG